MLKVGIIGCGGMGGIHAECYKALKGKAEITAVADVIAEKAQDFSKKFGGKAYNSGMELIENADVDMVDICLPSYLHAEHAIMAMEKGFHVFMEKPVCLKKEEAEKILETEKKTGTKIQIGQVMRYWDEYVWLKKTLDSGIYGKLVSASFNRMSVMPAWGGNSWYHDYKLSGSVAIDLHIHDTDFSRFLMGEPDDVYSCASRDENGVINRIFTTYHFGNTIITAEGGWNCKGKIPFRMTYHAIFEKASVLYENGKLIVYPEGEEPFTPEIKAEFSAQADTDVNISSLGAYYNEIADFVYNVINDKPIEIASASEAVKSLLLALRETEIAGGIKK